MSYDPLVCEETTGNLSYLEKMFHFLCSLPDMFQRFRIPLLFCTKENPTDINKNSRLCRLPFPVIESLAYAMDEFSITKLRMTSKSMNLQLKVYEEKLKKRTGPTMYIYTGEFDCEECKFILYIGNGDQWKDDGFGFPRFSPDNERSSTELCFGYLDGQHSCTGKSLVEWLMENPINTNIYILEFGMMSLDKKKLDALLDVIVRRNFRAKRVSLMDNEYNDHKALVRVLSALRISVMTVNWNSAEKCRAFLSRTLLKFISSIEQFHSEGLVHEIVRLPRNHLKLPPTFNFLRNCVFVDIKTFKRLMHAWYKSQVDIEIIMVSLPPIYKRADLLAAALRLFPQYVRDNWLTSEIGYTNERGKSCEIQRRLDNLILGDSTWMVLSERASSFWFRYKNS